jgi:hypothetical protein
MMSQSSNTIPCGDLARVTTRATTSDVDKINRVVMAPANVLAWYTHSSPTGMKSGINGGPAWVPAPEAELFMMGGLPAVRADGRRLG